MRLRTVALGALASMGACSAAFAQQGAQIPTVEPKRTLEFGGQVVVLHDSNFARSSRALAATRGIDPNETMVSPSATLHVIQPFGRELLFLNAAAGYDFHDKNKRLDREHYDITGGGVTSLGPCQQTVYGDYKARQSELYDLDTGTTKNLRQTTGVGLGLSCGREIGLGATAAVQRFQTKNSAVTAKESDNDVETLVAGIDYRHPTLGKLTLAYNYTSTELPNRIIPGRPIGDGFFTETIGAGYSRSIGSRLAVQAGIGRTMVKREFSPPGVSQKFHSTSYNGLVSYRLGSRIELQANAARAVKPSTRIGKLYDVSTEAEVLGRYKIGSRFEATLGHAYGKVNSNADTSISQAVITRSRSNTTYGSLRYDQGEHLTMVLDVRRENRKTNILDYNYNSTRVGLTAAVTF